MSMIGLLTVLVAGCASQPPTKPTALDPSNPNAPEAVPAALTPLVGSGTAPKATPPAAAEEPSAMPAGHHHGGHGASAAPAQDQAAPMPMDMPMDTPAKGDEHKKAAGVEKAAVTYTCPMHPEISSPKPGKCPKCGMTLVSPKPSERK